MSRIFLKGESSDDLPLDILETFIKDDCRMLIYKGETYKAEEFIEIFIKILELEILDFDHLTESEMRERGRK